jgi:hypothetical protein
LTSQPPVCWNTGSSAGDPSSTVGWRTKPTSGHGRPSQALLRIRPGRYSRSRAPRRVSSQVPAPLVRGRGRRDGACWAGVVGRPGPTPMLPRSRPASAWWCLVGHSHVIEEEGVRAIPFVGTSSRHLTAPSLPRARATHPSKLALSHNHRVQMDRQWDKFFEIWTRSVRHYISCRVSNPLSP